jgi:prepilin-type N-terminal cleavage/methylation domain-containing protein
VSRSTDRRRDGHADEGFTLVEIMVALGIFSVVLVALLPQLIGGIRATSTARVVSQGKGIVQGQLEQMRHLPFHIAPAAGDYVDVLDRYYPDLSTGSAPTCKSGDKYLLPAVAWTGYVADGSGPRCDYEPATGAFFRTVEVVPPTSGITGFTKVIDTQFLSGATPPLPVSPLPGYDTGTVGKDSPASSQIGVTVTILYDRRGTLHPITSYTQIAERLTSTTRVRSDANVRVLDLGTVTGDGVPLTLAAGLLNLAGSVSYASTARANLAATSAGLATGDQNAGASATLEAPPSVTTTAAPGAAGALSTFGCDYACWGGTSIPGLAMSAESGLPQAGTAAAPAQVLLTDLSNGGLSFGAVSGTSGGYRPALNLVAPLVRMAPSATTDPSGIGTNCVAGTTGTPAYLSASGYLATTAPDGTREVESCAVAKTATLELFRTNFAEHGVVQVQLTRASARCRVTGAGHSPTTGYDYEAVVRYWDGTGYTDAATIVPGQTSDALAAVPLTRSVGGSRTLEDYISSWSSISSATVVQTAVAGTAQVKLPGIVRIASQPVRQTTDGSAVDELSVVSTTVGALSCRAEDRR